MKAVIRIICATALLVTSSAWATTVDNVELSYEQGYTVAKIYVDGAVRFTHQSEVAKDGKPYRIIVDILAASHNLGGKEFLEVPACAIKGIRSSQYAVKPESICRVVFDMVGETVYRTEQQADAVVLYISDGFSQPFTNWSSKSWVASTSAPKHIEPVAEQASVSDLPESSMPTASAADANHAIANDHLASLQNEDTTSAMSEVASDDTTTEAKDSESPQAPSLMAQSFAAHASGGTKKDDSLIELADTTAKMSVADSMQLQETTEKLADSLTPEPWAMQVDFAPIVTAPIAEELKPETSPDVIPPATQEISDSQLAPATPNVSAAVVGENPGTAVPAAESTRVRERAARKKSAPMSSLGSDIDLLIDNPFAETINSIEKDSKESLAASESLSSQTPQPAMLADAEATTVAEPAKPAPAESKAKVSEPAKSSPKKMTNSENKSTLSSGDTMAGVKPSPADVAPAVDTSTNNPSIIDDAKNKSTARFRRDPITSKKMRGTLVAEFPQRMVIQYKGKSGRDPFETLVDQEKQYNTPVEKRIPNVEGLSLVGVIETGWGDNRALFEDRSGNGYIMQSGDKVQKGYVLRVEKDRVYFQLFEYGWSRTVSITIEDE
jgi:hypothetical protein